MEKERELDCNFKDCTILKVGKDNIIVKAKSATYYNVDKYFTDKVPPYPKEIYESNICIKIPTESITIDPKDPKIMLVSWFADTIVRSEYKVACPTN
jgi:hypothetical protein